jgi:hypothetical protein
MNPDISTIINIIDSKAYDIYYLLLKKNHKANMDEIKRFNYSFYKGWHAIQQRKGMPL